LEILKPIEIAVAWIMVQFHSLLTAAGMDPASGWTWALSIVGLTVVIRIILIPLFVKQINASRGMQLIQPELRKIQDKYKGKKDDASRQAMTKETMDLYKKTGTNPFSSCLPILLQMPIFFALFRVLQEYVGKVREIGPLTTELAEQANGSEILGAQLSSTFLNSGDDWPVKILTVVLIVLMSASQFFTQKQLMSKNMPASAMEGNPFMQQQKVLLYVLPLVFAVSGVNFPIGVLLYWLTTNFWSAGQQYYVIKRRPAPGSPAEAARNEKLARKGKPIPGAPVVVDAPVELEKKGQRVQPKRKDRGRKPGQPGQPGQPGGAATRPNGATSTSRTRAPGKGRDAAGKGPDAGAGT
jgi:YidC/Oxa1 family membrane protein insertase